VDPSTVLHIVTLDGGALYCYLASIHHLELRPANEACGTAAHVWLRFDNGDSVTLPVTMWDEVIAALAAWRRRPANVE
jgi:hypothetical protein